METLNALILGIIQGLTEYLPVSSSGHLQIGEVLLGVKSGESLQFGIVVHAATSLSSVIIFRKDIWELLKGMLEFKWNDSVKYVALLAVSAVPVVIVGLFFEDYIEELFEHNITLVGLMLILTGALLLFTQWAGQQQKPVGWFSAIVIGISQAIAVLPGISRSGATIATGLLLGVDKEKVAKFSFLMVIVPILGKLALDMKELFFEDPAIADTVGNGLEAATAAAEAGISSPAALAIGFGAAFLTGLAACKAMLSIVKKGQLWYFSVYCFIVGAIALAGAGGLFG